MNDTNNHEPPPGDARTAVEGHSFPTNTAMRDIISHTIVAPASGKLGATTTSSSTP